MSAGGSRSRVGADVTEATSRGSRVSAVDVRGPSLYHCGGGRRARQCLPGVVSSRQVLERAYQQIGEIG